MSTKHGGGGGGGGGGRGWGGWRPGLNSGLNPKPSCALVSRSLEILVPRLHHIVSASVHILRTIWVSITSQYLPAIEAVIKQAMVAANRVLRAILAMSPWRLGAIGPRPPSNTPRPRKFVNPHSAYVVMTSDRSWRESREQQKDVCIYITKILVRKFLQVLAIVSPDTKWKGFKIMVRKHGTDRYG